MIDMSPQEIGGQIGRAIAREALTEKTPRAWTGLGAQGSDQLRTAGILPDSPAWDVAEAAARKAYEKALRVERDEP